MSEKLRKKHFLRKSSSVAQFANQVGADEFKVLKEKFNLLCGKDGLLSRDLLGNLLSSLNINTTKEELETLKKEIDVDGDGKISFSEIIKGLKWIKTSNFLNKGDKKSIRRSESVTKFIEQLNDEEIKRVKQLFDVCDEDGDGIVTRNQFYKLTKDLGLDMSKSQVNMLFKNLDTNNDGSIEFEDFLSGVRWLQKGFKVTSINDEGVKDSSQTKKEEEEEDDDYEEEVKDLREKNRILVNFIKDLVTTTINTAKDEIKNKKLRSADLLLQIVDVDLLIDMEEYVGGIVSKQQVAAFRKLKNHLKEQANLISK